MGFHRRAPLSRADLVGRRAYLYPHAGSSQPPLSQVALWVGKVKATADERSVDVTVVDPRLYRGWTLRVTPRAREFDLAFAWAGNEVPVDLILASPGKPAAAGANAAFRLTPRV